MALDRRLGSSLLEEHLDIRGVLLAHHRWGCVRHRLLRVIHGDNESDCLPSILAQRLQLCLQVVTIYHNCLVLPSVHDLFPFPLTWVNRPT